MLARTNRNGLIIPHGADGLAWGKTARQGVASPGDWKIRLTASGIALCTLPACCESPPASGRFSQFTTLTNGFNGTFDLAPDGVFSANGAFCSWRTTVPTTASGKIGGLSCGTGTANTDAGGLAQVWYCRGTGEVFVYVTASITAGLSPFGGVVFVAKSAADPCWPVTVGNSLDSGDCGNCAGGGVTLTCGANTLTSTGAVAVLGYDGSVTLELLCPP